MIPAHQPLKRRLSVNRTDSNSEVAQPAMQRGISRTATVGTPVATDDQTDTRPCEEITISHKHTSAISDEEIQQMLYDENDPIRAVSAASASSQEGVRPSKVSSLQIIHNRCSLLPSSIARLEDLTSLKVVSNTFSLDDSGDTLMTQQLGDSSKQISSSSSTEQKESNSAEATSLTIPMLGRGSSGLRELKRLQSLEFVHESSPPLSSSSLPSSLTSLSVQNYNLCDNFFTSQLKNLRTLTLSHIHALKGLPEMNVLTQLESLSIKNNPYLTTLPSSLFKLPALKYADLSSNSLYSLPENLDEMTALEKLDLRMNRLIVIPRVFRLLKERGCEVLSDYVDETDADGIARRQSSMIAPHLSSASLEEEPMEEEKKSAPSSPAAAALAMHTTKRKARADINEAEGSHSKHARSSNKTSLHRPTTSANETDDENDADTEDADMPAPAAAAIAASSTAPARRHPMSKRKLPEEVTTLGRSATNDKRIKIDPAAAMSWKYYHGELEYADRIVNGFVDAGRKSKLFAELGDVSSLTLDDVYNTPVNHSEREIVLVDEGRDVRLKQILKQARLMLKQATQHQPPHLTTGAAIASSTSTAAAIPTTPVLSLEELQLQVKLLACLVSDSFGGRVVVFSPQQPFDDARAADIEMQDGRQANGTAVAPSTSSRSQPAFLSPLASLYSLCHAEVQWWKATAQTNVVLLCSIQHGLCRHRSILFKYLIEQLFSPADVAAKLVRGYREGGIGHAWNVVRFRDGRECIIDCLDSPHLFRPISSLVDPSFSYYPQWAISSSSAFATANGDSADTLASFQDLHLARRGQLLGEGAYSQVFECFLPYSAASSHPCALKSSPIGHLTTKQFAALLKEVRILPHLRHPNIVTFYGYIITNESLQVYMELVRGANLDTIIKTMRQEGRRFTVDDILVILFEIAKGLQYLHHQSTLHRDLKSAQVLIGHIDLLNGTNPDRHFSMPLLAAAKPSAHPDRVILKAKRKGKDGAASSSTPSPSTTAALTSVSHDFTPRSPSSSSFFSDASIKLCDFNIAIPVLEAHEDAEEKDAHLPKLEYVGTLRWVAPEIFRASLPDYIQPAVSDATAATTSTAASSSGSNLTPAALLLHQGKMSDCWSLGNIELELLSLHLPYEDVPTEPELNAKLTRGERSSYQQWLDPQYWPASEDEPKQKEMEVNAQNAWKRAVEVASETSGSAAASNSSSSSPSSLPFATAGSVYQSLVGLYLQCTEHTPTARPDHRYYRFDTFLAVSAAHADCSFHHRDDKASLRRRKR